MGRGHARAPSEPRLTEKRRRAFTAGILGAGFAAAIAIYAAAGASGENPLGYDPLQDKKYLHQLEEFGGKANVIAAEFEDWFASLWHGRRFAFTVAAMTLLAAWLFRFFTAPRPLDDEDADTPPLRLVPRDPNAGNG